MTRKRKDGIMNGLIYLCSGFTVLLLAVIIGFIVIKGMPGINIDFLTRQFDNKTTYVTSGVWEKAHSSDKENYVDNLGITLKWDRKLGVSVEEIDGESPVKNAVDGTGAQYAVEKGDVIAKAGSYNADEEFQKLKKESKGNKLDQEGEKLTSRTVKALEENSESSLRLKVMRPGGGIVPMAVTTLYMILLSLLIAGPVGILAAVYLNEYAKKGRIMTLIHFAIENLAGIPSIIYGLFGSLFFVQILKMQYSLLAGAMTVSIILLPTIISTTEEALKAIPGTYRESSLGLGATRLQTVAKVVLPNAVSGILVAVLLSVGRIVGESAALLLTAGTVAQIPKALFGNSASGATLTIKAYTLMKEENDLTTACAIGIVLLVLIILINVAAKLAAKKMSKTA